MKYFQSALIAILVALALLDLGPAIGISDQWNAILTIFLGLAFTLLHGGNRPWEDAIGGIFWDNDSGELYQ